MDNLKNVVSKYNMVKFFEGNFLFINIFYYLLFIIFIFITHNSHWIFLSTEMIMLGILFFQYKNTYYEKQIFTFDIFLTILHQYTIPYILILTASAIISSNLLLGLLILIFTSVIITIHFSMYLKKMFNKFIFHQAFYLLGALVLVDFYYYMFVSVPLFLLHDAYALEVLFNKAVNLILFFTIVRLTILIPLKFNLNIFKISYLSTFLAYLPVLVIFYFSYYFDLEITFNELLISMATDLIDCSVNLLLLVIIVENFVFKNRTVFELILKERYRHVHTH